MLTRRGFLGGAAALSAVYAKGAPEAPLWKAGIVTDTHVERTRESCRLVKMACDLFAEHDIDLFVNCGDIADHYYEEAYPILKELTDAAFPRKTPRKIWVYANHDTVGRKDEPIFDVFADVKRLLGATNDLFDVIDFKGYPLVVFPQMTYADWPKERHRDREKLLADVIRRYPKGPIFVFDHFPAYGTVHEPGNSGHQPMTDLLSSCPRIIHFSGHEHSSLQTELSIWQGAFTEVSVGCLQVWHGKTVGSSPAAKPNFGALVMEVYPSRIVFRRFDVRTREEYHAENPWTVPLPFDPKTAPYTTERRMAREPIPRFPSGAKLELGLDDPFSKVTLRFPAATGRNGVYKYRIDILAEDGARLTTVEKYGDFYKSDAEKAKTVELSFACSYFTAGTVCMVKVTPCDPFARGGVPIASRFEVPKKQAVTSLYVSGDPMKELAVTGFLRKESRTVIPDGEGWIVGEQYVTYRVELPKAVLGKRKKGEIVRVVADLETDREGPTMTKVRAVDLEAMTRKGPRPFQLPVTLPVGKGQRVRCVLDCVIGKRIGQLAVTLSDCEKGRFRFRAIRVEVVNA